MRHFWRFASSVVVCAVAVLCLQPIVSLSGQGVPPPPPAPQRQQPQAETPKKPAGTGKILGKVLALDNEAPVKRAVIMLMGGPTQAPTAGRGAAPGSAAAAANAQPQGRGVSGPPPGYVQTTQETDASGRFEFTGLPAGRFSVNAMSPGNFTGSQSESVQLSDGGSTTLTFRLERTGVITGKVYDEAGEPLPRAMVRATRWLSTGGTRRLVPSGNGSNGTDDRGEYRLWDLPPGEYFVSAVYMSAGNFPQSNFDRTEEKYGLAPTYYPGVPSIDAARFVTVRSGQEMVGVDITMQRAKMGRITATVFDSNGMPLSQNGYVSLASRTDSVQGNSGMSRRPDGTFVSGDVPPGEYYLTANLSTREGPNSSTSEGAIALVTVNGDDVSATLQLNKGATVSGKVVVEGQMPEGTQSYSTGPQQTVQSRIIITARQATNSTAMYIQGTTGGRPAPMADDGTFQLTGLRGSLRLSATGNRAILKSARRGGQDILATPLQLDGTENITDVELVVTTDLGTIDATVSNTKGEPAAGAWVIIFSDDESLWFEGSPYVRPGRTATATTSTQQAGAPSAGGSGSAVPTAPPATGSTGAAAALAAANREPGHLVSQTIVPGRYGVIAFESSTSGSGPAYDREAIEKMKSRATYVTVIVGQTATVRLKTVKQ